MSKTWEVDPETRSKLLGIQKTNENNRCVDCNAPSPQWASPKFGVFMCLTCSGVHRGLGVHISFVRSITMDSFKIQEVQRMACGGNKPWREFFDAHASNKLGGRAFEDCTIGDRYDSEAGEEWKERLSAKVEGKDYVPGTRSFVARGPKKDPIPSANITPVGSRSQTPLSRVTSEGRSASPGLGTSRKVQNEAYFARMGGENASRPVDLPPSQGGKFSGFGSEPSPARNTTQDTIPGVDEFQKDPVAALTKGFGWLSSTVGKQAKTINEGWVKPNIQKLAEADLATQARLTAAQLGQNLQHSTKNAADSLSRFVEGDQHLASHNNKGPDPDKRDFWESFGEAPKGPSSDKKDFWDDFSSAADVAQSKSKPAASIGTSAMKKPAANPSTGAGAGKRPKEGEDGWGDW
ncbi:ADP-ribosylation factor GTPase-activating protein gcs1 [Elasticomyces elasticus]|nr:ADP-ribosylation factor GTPase-activating protein gcs1 [Elasticomyces elasticus]